MSLGNASWGMSARRAALGGLLLATIKPVIAHRLDEYLQATILAVEKDRVKADLYLTAGAAMMPYVLKEIDSDGDGVLSATEQRAYATRVLADLSLTLNGTRLTPRLVSLVFPKIEDMREGLGDIHLEFAVDLPRAGADRILRMENRHQSQIAVYQVNCLISRDPTIRIGAQVRSENQSVYQLAYTQAGGR